ncbi:NAD-dependent epimerase/dehydratase family protein, partial [Candidatus Bathyarchaeota archaeon]|nr:NAD-dependent epimerase/dehydratase family protein [Candidatus Bathyarchaeota archaeon]
MTNELFLVTGVNGLIASHVADQLLAAGHRVRGTVRSATHASWLLPLFESRHGPGRFGLVQLDGAGGEAAWEAALRGVSGVASVASPNSLDVKDVGAAVEDELRWFHALLAAAKKTASVRSVSFTSSAWAVYTPEPNVPMVLREDSWNEAAVARAADSALSDEEMGLARFMVVKVRVERGCWDWVARERPAFRFNAVLPDTVLGPILAPAHQGGSTAGMLVRLFEGRDYGVVEHIAPQWFVDARDVGRLYVAALTDASVEGRRVFACAERYSWHQVLGIMRGLFPGREFVELGEKGVDMAEMPNGFAGELLGRMGKGGWVG